MKVSMVNILSKSLISQKKIEFNVANILKSYSSLRNFTNFSTDVKPLPFSVYKFPVIQTESDLEKARQFYTDDIATYRTWLSLEFVKMKGRVYAPNKQLIPKNESFMKFPNVIGTTLNGNEIVTSNYLNSNENDKLLSKNKLVVFYFKEFGYDLTQSWVIPFEKKYGIKIPIIEISFVEYSFLSFTKQLFVSNLKKIIPQNRWESTILTFGGLKVSNNSFIY